MDVKDAYKELEAHLEKGEALLCELDPEVGLSWQYLEWGEYAKTVIAVIDPHGKIYEKSTPVGMFYDGWNIATFYWSDYDEKKQKKRNIEGFAAAVGALRAIIKTRPSPHPANIATQELDAIKLNKIEENAEMTAIEQWFGLTVLKEAVPFLFDEARRILAERRKRRQQLGERDDTVSLPGEVEESDKDAVLKLKPADLSGEIQKDIDSYLDVIKTYKAHRRAAEEKIAKMGGILYVTPPVRTELENAEDEVIKYT